MKKSFLIGVVTTGLLILGVGAHRAGKNFRTAQDSLKTMPSLNLLLTDSSTKINTKDMASNDPIVLIYFSPDCEHCQVQIQEIIDHIQSLQNVQFVLLTPISLHDLKEFGDKLNISQYKNITLAYDYCYLFYKYFKAKSFPYVAIYNGQKQLVKLYKREIKIDRLIKAVSI